VNTRKLWACIIPAALALFPVTVSGARLVSVGTSITETLRALNVADQIVAVDNSSKEYFTEVAKLPGVGAFRTISAEGIVSLKPDLVFLAFDAGPPESIKQMRDAGLTVIVAPRNYSVEEVIATVRFLAAKLNRQALGEEVIRSIRSDFDIVAAFQKRIHSRLRVLFCGLGPNMPTGSISGVNTRIDEMIKLAGGVNPIQSFEGFRPMTDEGVIAAAPDAILITEKSFERAGGVDGVRKLPGIVLTPAGKNRRVVPVSDLYFAGFGPGIGKAVLDLTKKLYPELR
jgi:iron complex transport system substrate-binding protein